MPASRKTEHIRDIDEVSPDTDVFVFLLDFFSTRELQGELHFVTGKGKTERKINIRDRCRTVGKGLLGLHAFSGADWGGKFSGVTKKRWIKHYLSLEEGNAAVDVLQKFGEDSLDLKGMSHLIENFVCQVYSKTSKCSTVKELRWELFKSKNLEAEKLPPTLGALTPHIQRANLVSRIGKGHRVPRPHIPSLLQNGWEESPDGTVSPRKCLELPAPQAVVELVKCGCRGKCKR